MFEKFSPGTSADYVYVLLTRLEYSLLNSRATSQQPNANRPDGMTVKSRYSTPTVSEPSNGIAKLKLHRNPINAY